MDCGRYELFLRELGASEVVVREDTPSEEALPGEMELQSLWFSGAFGSRFVGTNGRTVRIRDIGHWNHAAGADFTDCAVEIDGEVLRGDIELDTDIRDWERHGHGANAAFGETILHLSFTGPKGEFFVRNFQHREIACVRLSLADVTPISPRRLLAEAHVGRCAQPLREMDAARVEDLLREAARYRLDLKSRRLVRAMVHHGREEALYQGIAEALGYRVNKIPLRIMAQRLPLALLRAKSPAMCEALLFGIGGFIEGDPREASDGETAKYLRELWDTWWKVRAEFSGRSPLNWKTSGSRPGNHPQRRVAALGALISAWSEFVPLTEAGSFDQPAVMKFFGELEHPYWSHHYTLAASPAKSPLALVGATRATEILANQIYPLLVHEDASVWESYLKLPSRLTNQKARRAALRLFGDREDSGQFQKKMVQLQGLLQIFDDFCLEDDSACENCEFPQQIKFW